MSQTTWFDHFAVIYMIYVCFLCLYGMDIQKYYNNNESDDYNMYLSFMTP